MLLLFVLFGFAVVFCLLPALLFWFLGVRGFKKQFPTKKSAKILFSCTLLIISSIYIEYVQRDPLGILFAIPAHIMRMFAIIHLVLVGTFKFASLVDRWYRGRFSRSGLKNQ